MTSLLSDSFGNIIVMLEINYSHQDILNGRLLSCVVLVVIRVIKHEEIKLISFKDMSSFTWVER